MVKTYSAIVIGLGVMGSATLWRLSQRQSGVLGLDARPPINLQGSSYGGSRIFRKAYWEGPAYLPLLAEADRGWRELQAGSPRSLLHHSGGLFIGPTRSGVVSSSMATAHIGSIACRHLTARQIKEQFPAFRVSDQMEAVFEEGAYTIAADDARLEMLSQAIAHGAEVRFGCELTGITQVENALRLCLADGQVLYTEKLVLATGPGLAGTLIPDLAGLLSPRSVPIYWCGYRPGTEANFFRFPAFLYELADGRLLYGTPQIDNSEPGIKIGFHNYQQRSLNVDTQLQPVSDALIDEMTSCVAEILPDLIPRPYASRKCVYTLTPDASFVIGESQAFAGVFYVSACSGHGFKFAPALGRCLAESLAGNALEGAVQQFSRERFAR